MKRFVSARRCVVGLFGITACVLALSGGAADFILTGVPQAAADWKDGAFYAGGAAPTGASTDRIAFAKRLEVEVSGSDAVTLSFLAGVERLIITNAVFAINVPAGDPVSFGGSVMDLAYGNGRFEKRGEGELDLTACQKWDTVSDTPRDYDTNIKVCGGILKLPVVSPSSALYCAYEIIEVAEGATLQTVNRNVMQCTGLRGAGLVTNVAGTVCKLFIQKNYEPETVDFFGRIGGPIQLTLRKNADQRLSGVTSTYSAGTLASANHPDTTLRVASLGSDSAPSSVGCNTTALTFGERMRVVYEGAGETMNRKLNGDATEYTLDGGTSTAFTVSGNIVLTQKDWPATRHAMTFAGEEGSSCTFSGAFDPDGFGGALTHWSVIKSGAGTWRFTAADRGALDGCVSVENGTLIGETLRERGLACSLGMATADRNAFSFGSATDATAKGLLSYAGSAAVNCLDRPSVLAGTGGFHQDAGAGLVRYMDVTAAGAGAKTLVLSGSSTAENAVYDVTNGAGVVSVRKEGAGTWILGGELDFSGSLDVLGGKLIIRRTPSRYTSYRLVVKEVAAENSTYSASYASTWTSTWGNWAINEIGLYDADGKRVNIDLTAASSWAGLAAGQVVFAGTRPVEIEDAQKSIVDMFDDSGSNPANKWNGVSARLDARAAPNRDKSETWATIEMKLKADANPVVQYDICSGYKKTSPYGGRSPSAVSLYGSADGVHWDLLGEEFDEISALPETDSRWLKNGNAFSTGKERKGTIHENGWMLKKTAPDRVWNVLDDVGAVTVANGAKLVFEGENPPELSSLAFDAASVATASGSIEGFALADAGSLDVKNLDPTAREVTLPIAFKDVEGVDGLSGWQLKVNGADSSKYSVTADSNGIHLKKMGLILIFR